VSDWEGLGQLGDFVGLGQVSDQVGVGRMGDWVGLGQFKLQLPAWWRLCCEQHMVEVAEHEM
jgi:hypothetical protein